MIRLVALVWPGHAWVLAEESPGVVRRLVGDPFGEDGALPLLLTRLGRETHIGTLAECVAYESPRARTLTVFGDGEGVESVECTARFLLVLDETVRRRFPQDELFWRFCVAASVSSTVLATLSAACWIAGLGDARVGRLPPWPAAPSRACATTSTAMSVYGLFDGDVPAAGLACPQPGAAPLVIDVRREDAGPADMPADVAAQAARRRVHIAAWRRGVVCEGSGGATPIALPDRGRWLLESPDAEEMRGAEIASWQRLAHLLAEPAWAGMGATSAVVEWGQRHWAARVRGVGGQALLQALGTPVDIVPLEALTGLFDDAANVLDRTLAFALESESGTASDHKVVATRGAALPFRSEHLLHLGRAGRQHLSFELHALDDDTSMAYRMAGGELALPAASRARTPVQLTVTCHACGALELAFDIPTWHFRETLVVDAAGNAHPDARRCALHLHAGL